MESERTEEIQIMCETVALFPSHGTPSKRTEVYFFVTLAIYKLAYDRDKLSVGECL